MLKLQIFQKEEHNYESKEAEEWQKALLLEQKNDKMRNVSLKEKKQRNNRKKD